nr:hypothetical protein [Tanacetum cinerariifolium]
MQMVRGNGGNWFRQYAGQNVGNLNGYNDVQNVRNQVIQNAIQNPRIQNVGNQNGLIGVPDNANQNPNGNGNIIAARVEGNATGHNDNQIRCYNYRGEASTSGTQIDKAPVYDSDGSEASTSGTQIDKAPVYDSDGSVEVHNYEDCYDNEIFNMFTQEEQYTELLKPIPELHQVPQNDNNVISEVSSVEQSRGTVDQHLVNVEETRVLYDSLYNNLAIEVEKFNKHKALELKIKRLLIAVVSQDIIFVVQNNFVDETSNLQTELERTKERFENCIIKKENEYAKLWNDWCKKCEECKFNKISYDKAYIDMHQKIKRLQAQLGDLKGKSKDTSCVSDTLNPLSQKLENKNVELEFQVSDQKDTACGTSATTKFEMQSILGKPPKVGETHALSKPVTSNLIPTPQRSKVVKNVKVIAPGMFRINPFTPSREEKHMPNKVRASIRTNPITVSQPLVITKKVLNSDSNGLSSTGKQKVNVSINEKQKKQQPKVKKTKKAGFIERLASPKPSKPRSFLRWSPTGRLFYLKGKIIASSESESQSDCSKGDNACTSNPLEPTIKRFPNSTFSLACYPNMFMFWGTVRFENDYIAAILGFDDLQWGNILNTRVYFVEGLGHNLFSVGQFCDSDLEVAFRRNTFFIRNLKGVDLLKGNHTTNLYTINLHEMASVSPICLMARATSTKSWLWHQRLSHLNFDTLNDLAKNALVFGVPKFKYHKEHLCPACEQGKRKRASHPPKPVPNSRQRLHLLHMDLCGPMRIASINGKRVYNRRIKKIIETMNMSFDELLAMAFEQRSSKPGLQIMTYGQINLGLDLKYAPSTITTQQPTKGELDLLFKAMYDDYIGGQPSSAP